MRVVGDGSEVPEGVLDSAGAVETRRCAWRIDVPAGTAVPVAVAEDISRRRHVGGGHGGAVDRGQGLRLEGEPVALVDGPREAAGAVGTGCRKVVVVKDEAQLKQLRF